MTSHSTVGASVIKRRKICPGSRRLEATVPNKSSKFSIEGTQAHALGEQWLTAGECPVGADTEMAENVRTYVEFVESLCEEGDELLLEHKFHLTKVHADLFGTADAVVWKPATKTLWAIDFKYGAGVPVEVTDNLQLMYYALGALLETGHPATKVVMAIVQPRCPHPDGPIRTQEIDAITLIDYADDLYNIVTATENPDAPLVPSEECRFCSAAGICPGLTAKAQEVAKNEFGPTLSYSPEQLAETLRWLPVLEGWINSVREFAYGEAEHGRTPPGFKLVDKVARRKWRDESTVTVALDELGLEPHDYQVVKLATPAQIEKLLPKEQRALLNELTIKESSGLALAPEDDRRPAVKMDAKSEFSAA